jgi:hypothetical protein
MCAEDKRTAVKITTNLSGQLITAALAMLAIEGGVISFVYRQEETGEWFMPLIIIAAAAFVTSIFLAGKGITKLRDSGQGGTWDIAEGKYYFNWQAISCLVGLCCFFASAFTIGTEKGDGLENRVALLISSVTKLERQMEKHEKVVTSIMTDVKNNNIKIEELKYPKKRIKPMQ